MRFWERTSDKYTVAMMVDTHEEACELWEIIRVYCEVSGKTTLGLTLRGGYKEMPVCICGHDEILHFAFLFGLDEPVGAEAPCEDCGCSAFEERKD